MRLFRRDFNTSNFGPFSTMTKGGAPTLVVLKISPTLAQLEAFCCCSVTQSCLTLCNPMDCSTSGSLSSSISWSLLKFMSTEVVMPSNHLIFCCFLLLLPSVFLSIKIFSRESAVRIRWPKYWSFREHKSFQ